MPSHAYYWESEVTSEGCVLSTSTGNNFSPKVYARISFSFHPSGENQYLSHLNIKPELPFISVEIADFSYRELVDNTKEIMNVTIDNTKGIEYKGKEIDHLTNYLVFYFGNETFSNLYKKAKNKEPFTIEFDTKKGPYKTSLNFIYNYYEEDLLFKEKSREFEDCINTHNQSLKSGTPQSGAP